MPRRTPGRTPGPRRPLPAPARPSRPFCRESRPLMSYPLFFKYVLRNLDPEQAHHLAFGAIRA
ncbi:MAG: hypothetical protein HOU01_19655, partial [Streptomycetaceae bacterium]|nr:hypothetical protein [Streptomycetaceae bacterium]